MVNELEIPSEDVAIDRLGTPTAASSCTSSMATGTEIGRSIA
jgi:hypothetical protein